MKNIALVLSYDGTNFNGWQIQKNGPSIQESMEDAIFHLLKQKVHVSGVGRTDSGVHARRYVANFHADCTIPMNRLPYALNSFLPEDIAVSGAVEVPEDFDARFNCTKKEYRESLDKTLIPYPTFVPSNFSFIFNCANARKIKNEQIIASGWLII